jgi:hypothetical protein
MKPTLEQVREFMDTGAPPKGPPTPHEIALTLSAALLSSGRYADDMGAAINSAWRLVIDFYAGQRAYQQDVQERAAIASMVTGKSLSGIVAGASEPEGEMSRAEARAYVTGGETGQIGEGGGGHMTVRAAPASYLNPPQDQANWTDEQKEGFAKAQRLAELAQKVAKLQEAYLQKEHEVALVAQHEQGKKESSRLRGLRKQAKELRAEFDVACKEQSAAYL